MSKLEQISREINEYMHNFLSTDILANRPKKSKIIPVIIMIFFTLFGWGFLYNLFIRIGFNEINAQVLGLSLSILAVLIVEGVTRIRLKLLIKHERASV